MSWSPLDMNLVRSLELLRRALLHLPGKLRLRCLHRALHLVTRPMQRQR